MAGNNSSGIPSCLVEVFHQLLLITGKIATSLPSSETFRRDHRGGLQNSPDCCIHLLSNLGKSQRARSLFQPMTVNTSLGAAVFKNLGLVFPTVLLLAGWSLKSRLQLPLA